MWANLKIGTTPAAIVLALLINVFSNNVHAQSLSLPNNLDLAFQFERLSKQETLIRWAEKPKLLILFASSLTVGERLSIEREARNFANSCDCLISVDALDRATKFEDYPAQTAVVVVDKLGYSRALSEFSSILKWAYPSEVAMQSALPAHRDKPSLNFRVGMNGADVVRSLGVVSITSDDNHSLGQVSLAFLFSLSPTLSRDVKSALAFFGKKVGPNGDEYFIDERGFKYLKILYGGNLLPGMTKENASNILH